LHMMALLFILASIKLYYLIVRRLASVRVLFVACHAFASLPANGRSSGFSRLYRAHASGPRGFLQIFILYFIFVLSTRGDSIIFRGSDSPKVPRNLVWTASASVTNHPHSAPLPRTKSTAGAQIKHDSAHLFRPSFIPATVYCGAQYICMNIDLDRGRKAFRLHFSVAARRNMGRECNRISARYGPDSWGQHRAGRAAHRCIWSSGSFTCNLCVVGNLPRLSAKEGRAAINWPDFNELISIWVTAPAPRARKPPRRCVPTGWRYIFNRGVCLDELQSLEKTGWC
jgi:hypothetical protein